MKTILKNSSANRSWMIGMLFVILMGFSHEGWSQRNWSLEFRPGANFPTSDLNSNSKLNTGFGFEGVISYDFMTQLGVYAGWSWNRFSSDQTFAGPNMDVEETGYTYGVQYFVPVGTGDSRVFFKAGGLWNHLELEDSNGELVNDSGHGFGWQLESGISIPVSERFKIQPGIRYRSLSRDFSSGTTSIGANLNYISLGLGIVYGL
ncbi:outer membrane beta-barrel protein [Cyclobacterium jeungdonense]|uniref:Outer membrane beta-barrel protein n=1 Tax=Cyclobacterium jeungdonense TaxID=708087 RepID=A0ABT8C5U8_9BACT|nr:outer membrane beta-barrel protein [Cyclobacterium jeungdonense]MDN3687752.1 outer membrane beta-barrel protein [Cyclobacterium jeungdonense]